MSPKNEVRLKAMDHFVAELRDQRGVEQYERNGVHITIKWGPDGRATIWDKDVLIYAISQIYAICQLVEALNQGRPISRNVRVTAYDLLTSTNRHTGGEIKAVILMGWTQPHFSLRPLNGPG